MVTFDQWLDIIVRISLAEDGFDIQADVHATAALIFEWKDNVLSNAQMIEALNFDSSDSELTTVKTHLNGLNNADTLALQQAMILAALNVTLTGITYNKALLRTRFGL